MGEFSSPWAPELKCQVRLLAREVVLDKRDGLDETGFELIEH